MKDVKPYKLVVRIKNNRLWRAVLELHPWVKTQHQAADAVGVALPTFGLLLNMKHWPGRVVKDETCWSKSAAQVSKALGYEPSYLFDPVYYGAKAVQAPKFIQFEVAINEVEQIGLLELPPPAEEVAEKLHLESNLLRTMASLTPREEGVLRMRFGIGGEKEHTLREIAGKMHFTCIESVRHIEHKALRKLRTPWLAKRILKESGS